MPPDRLACVIGMVCAIARTASSMPAASMCRAHAVRPTIDKRRSELITSQATEAAARHAPRHGCDANGARVELRSCRPLHETRRSYGRRRGHVAPRATSNDGDDATKRRREKAPFLGELDSRRVRGEHLSPRPSRSRSHWRRGRLVQPMWDVSSRDGSGWAETLRRLPGALGKGRDDPGADSRLSADGVRRLP